MTKGDKDKVDRLGAALRENLKRRKTQSRDMASREVQPNSEPTQPAKE